MNKFIMMSKICLFLLVVSMLTAFAKDSYGQNVKISMELYDVSLQTVIDEIKRQTDFEFAYDSELGEVLFRKVSIKTKDANIEQVLSAVLADIGISFRVIDRIVLLSKSELSKTPKATGKFQGIPITGTVSDNFGDLMPGVAVVIRGSNVGTSTDRNGEFTIAAPSDTSVLQFRFVGYRMQEVVVGNRRIFSVTMQEEAAELGEVVVVAFGTQKKKDLIGSVTIIKPAELRAPTSNLTTMLAGQAAGIISYQRTGEPGEDNANFFVRGITSFGVGKVDPLILIDGMELGVTELARLRPDDIESFSIFKDATSTALYGARGANGVIYVTTKQGREGPPKVSWRSEVSISSPTQNIEFVDPVTYMNLYESALYARDPFARSRYTREKIDATAMGLHPVVYPAIDWRESLFKNNTTNHRHDLSVNGGGTIARYFVSGSFTQDNGVLQVDKRNNFNSNINLKSYTLRANVNINLTKKSELVVRLSGNFDNYMGPIDGGNDLYYKVVRTSPVDFLPAYPVDDQHQYVQHIMFGGLSTRSYLNPYADLLKGYREYDRSLMLAQIEFKQDLDFIVNGLSFRALINTNRTSRFDQVRQYKPFFYELTYYDKRTGKYAIDCINEASGEEYLGFSGDEAMRVQESIMYGESVLNYTQTFAEKHSISALLVGIIREQKKSKAESLQLSLPSRNLGLSGRFTYSYDSRYYAEFNFGYNGSEKFSKDKRFGFFPSYGVAWAISNESFWEPLKDVVNLFKIRATHGLVGNDEIGSATDRFFYLSNVNMSYGNFAWGRESGYSIAGVRVDRYANPDITWEVSRKTNLAFEIGLFDNLNVQMDIFRENRSNILMTRADIPSTMGLTALSRANIGEAAGKGLEISSDYSHFFTNNFWIQLRGNFTYATNEFKVYEEPVYEKEWWKSRIGYPISQPWGYIAERLFVDDSEVANSPSQIFGGQANIAGDIKYKDVNGDGEITQLDMVPMGFPLTPEIIYGGGFSIGYKSFDFSAFFQGSARSSFWMGGEYVSAGRPYGPAAVEPFVDGKNIIRAFADSHYSLETQDIYALWPRLSTDNHANNTQYSSWWLNDGKFVRLKRVEIGWSLPAKAVRKLNMTTLRLYASGSNLLLFSKFKLWDVEMGGNGLGYPLQRTYNIGINVVF